MPPLNLLSLPSMRSKSKNPILTTVDFAHRGARVTRENGLQKGRTISSIFYALFQRTKVFYNNNFTNRLCRAISTPRSKQASFQNPELSPLNINPPLGNRFLKEYIHEWSRRNSTARSALFYAPVPQFPRNNYNSHGTSR